jgi:hypothetical protein
MESIMFSHEKTSVTIDEQAFLLIDARAGTPPASLMHDHSS